MTWGARQASRRRCCSWALNGQRVMAGEKEKAEMSPETIVQGRETWVYSGVQGCFTGGKACKRKELRSGDLGSAPPS